MEPIAKRLKSFLQFKGLTTTAFTRTLEYSSCEKVARLFRVPGAKPSVDILEDIAKHFEELNLRWLITGHGEMLSGSFQPVAPPEKEASFDPPLHFLHTANADEYLPFRLKGEEDNALKPLRGSMMNFIENLQDEQ